MNYTDIEQDLLLAEAEIQQLRFDNRELTAENQRLNEKLTSLIAHIETLKSDRTQVRQNATNAVEDGTPELPKGITE